MPRKALITGFALCFAIPVAASELDDCLNAKVKDATTNYKFETIGGCNTADVEGIALSCEATVCLTAPAGFIIAGDVDVDDSEARGAAHEVSRVNYTRNVAGQTERACSTLHVQSVKHRGERRGSSPLQRIKLHGELQRLVTADMMREFATACIAKK